MAIVGNGRVGLPAAGILLAALLTTNCPLRAQRQPAAVSADTPSAAQASAAVPAAPDPDAARSSAPAAPQDPPHSRDDRIFGVMPNYLTVEGAHDLPPLSTGEKFKLAAAGTFDPYEFAIVGFLAGINQATDKDNSYGQGATGYAKRYGAGFADQGIGNIMTGAVFPSLLHQDPRYYQLGQGGFKHRAKYALSRIIVTRTDAGASQFNYSEFLGSASGAGISLIYRDQADRTAENTAITWVEQIGVDALGYELKEFWPDIHRKLRRKKTPPEE